MMPPTSIDGTDITGATIDGTDVQEITVDGQTVFSAGPGGVASGVPIKAHYPITESSGTTISDVTGTLTDMDVDSNASFQSDIDAIGGQTIDTDGDHVNVFFDVEPSFILTDTYTLMFTFDVDNIAPGQATMVNDATAEILFGAGRNTGDLVAGTTNNIKSNHSFTTGRSRYGVEMVNGLPQDIHVDGLSGVTSTSETAKGSGFEDDFRIGGTLINTNDNRSTDGRVDNIVFYDRVLTASEVTDDFNAQPWS